MWRWLLVSVIACGCACGRGAGGGGTGGTGGGGSSAADCDAVAKHVADLYRADAADTMKGKDEKLLEQIVADNTKMVMAECAREPARVAGCAGQAKSAPELERTCLAPLDDEGTEGDRFTGTPAEKQGAP
jgi:hypothetical protein